MIDKHWADVELSVRKLIAEQAALLDLKGIGINEQVKQLAAEYEIGLTRTRLIALKRLPIYQDVKKKAIEADFEAGTLDLKKMAVDLLPDVYNCLKVKLQEGDTKAAALVITLFTGDKSEGPQQAQQINLTLATDVKPK